MPHLYLTQPKWETGPDAVIGGEWRNPSDFPLGILRFANDSQKADRIVTTQQWLVVTSQLDPNLSGYLGEFADPDSLRTGTMTRRRKAAFETALGLAPGTLNAQSPIEMVAEFCAYHGDPTGESRNRPLVFQNLHLDGYPGRYVYRTQGPLNDPQWYARWRDEFREDYRAVYTRSVLANSDYYKMWLGSMARRNRVPPEEFVPPGLTFEGTLPERTPKTDAFTEASDTEMSAHTSDQGDSWTEVSGDSDVIAADDNCQATSVPIVRLEVNIASGDHYAQVDFVSFGSNNATVFGPCVRFAAAATTYYVGWTQARAGGFHRIYQNVTGSYSQLATTANSATPPINDERIVCETSGADAALEYFTESTSRLTHTDTSPISAANVRTGLDGNGFGSANGRVDNFEADVTAAVGVTPRLTLLGVG